MALALYTIVIVSIVFCIAYVFLIGMYCYGWHKTPLLTFDKIVKDVHVCVVIPARNEEKNIEQCIQSVLAQNYPSQLMDIIVVDDCSEDSTNKIIQQISLTNSNVRLITSKVDRYGKKAAIEMAVRATNAELIITTDADCVMGNSWVASIVAFYKKTSARMICGPVMFRKTAGVLEKMQQQELMVLVASGAASLFYNKATLCNGANLAYTKQAFMEVDGFIGIDGTPTGDDVLLMYKIKERYNGSVLFLKNKDAIVYTNPVARVKELLEQRKRWASKDFSVLNTETQLSSVIIGGFNIALCVLFFICCFYKYGFPHDNFSFIIFYLLLGIKCIIDFLLLFLASLFFKTKWHLKYFLLQEVLYSPYVLIVWLKALQRNYEWKGRIYH